MKRTGGGMKSALFVSNAFSPGGANILWLEETDERRL